MTSLVVPLQFPSRIHTGIHRCVALTLSHVSNRYTLTYSHTLTRSYSHAHTLTLTLVLTLALTLALT